MHYQPILPKKNNNISPTHPLKEFATLLAGMLGFLFFTYFLLGFLVDAAINHISPKLERELFNHTPIPILTTADKTPDPRQKKLQQLADKLRKCIGIKIPIIVHIQHSDTINAMALPGGHIIVFTGLLDTIKTENSLSFILGHELGHFKNRDHLRGLGRGLVLMTIATAMTGPNSSLTHLLTPTIQLQQAQYSQHREALADQTGLVALHCYYGHVGGATDFFKFMAATQNESSLSHYFQSHPAIQKRIEDLHSQADNHHWPSLKTIPLQL